MTMPREAADDVTKPVPAGSDGLDIWEQALRVDTYCESALAMLELEVAGSSRFDAVAPATLQPPVLNLACQDMVMRCLDRDSPPGYLTFYLVRDILDVPLGEAMGIFACAADAWRKQRIKHMPDVLNALHKAHVQNKAIARELL